MMFEKWKNQLITFDVRWSNQFDFFFAGWMSIELFENLQPTLITLAHLIEIFGFFFPIGNNNLILTKSCIKLQINYRLLNKIIPFSINKQTSY